MRTPSRRVVLSLRLASLSLVSLLFVGIVCLPARAADWSGTLADQMISFDDNEYARAVQVVVGAQQGQIHAIWTEDAPTVREVHYGFSGDWGITWTSSAADRVISFPDGYGVNPEDTRAALAPNGTLIVVWSEDVDATREVHYGVSTDNGVSWSCETQDLILSDPTSAVDTNAPSVAVDATGVMHVVWTQTSLAGSVEVFYSRSADGGATWTGANADRMISYPDGGGAISPQLVVQSDGSLLVVWRETGSGGPAIHAGLSADGGVTWSSETADREVSLPASIITNLAASADPCIEGTHVVYTASFDTASPYHYEVYATSTDDFGQTWSGESANTLVSHDEGGARSASNPDVFVGWGQGAVAVWDEEEDASGTKEIHVSHGPWPWTGADADEIISFPDGENGYRPSVSGFACTISANGVLRAEGDDTVVLWTEFAGGTVDNYEVHLSTVQLMSGSVDDVTDARPGLRVFPNPSVGPVRVDWGLLSGVSVHAVEIFDAGGRRVRVLAGGDPSSPAAGTTWDGCDADGRPVPSGYYFARLLTNGGLSRPAPFVVL